MKLTIGMATYDDYDGCYFTLQALRLYHDLTDVELLVVDNKPDHPSSETLRNTIKNMMDGRRCHSARYVAAPEATGTSQPRNRVFAEARGDWVWCIDSHVMMQLEAVRRFLEWTERNPDSRDLVSGPLMYDSLEPVATQFDDEWRGEMWGTWGCAWEVCPGGDVVATSQKDGKVTFRSLEMRPVTVTSAGRCPDVTLPKDLPHAGHEQELLKLGFRRLGWSDDDEFEIPGMGLGLFACRRDAWLKFNESFRGFGGEEMYIHEKFRKAGHRCLCLGFLKWVHRFHRSNGTRYPLTLFDRVRNYVLGAVELGMPLEDIRKHFVVEGRLPVRDWDTILKDPVNARAPVPVNVHDMTSVTSPQDAFDAVKAIPRDFDQHMVRLRELAARCQHVTEFSHRRESLLSLVMGCPEVVSHNTEADDPLTRRVIEMLGNASKISVDKLDSTEVLNIQETDLLFVDSVHTKARLLEELKKFLPQVRRFLVLHDLEAYGSRGEDNGPGLMEALREFMEDEHNAQWFVAGHVREQHGYTVLGCQEIDRPPVKISLWLPGHGVGTALRDMIKDLGITQPPNCSCTALQNQMDILGPDECEKKKDEFVEAMKKNWSQWGWKDKITTAATAGIKAILGGMIFKIHPTSPIESLIDEAIRRTRESKV